LAGRIWFPSPQVGVSAPPLVGPARAAPIAMGTFEAVVFIVGILLIGTGIADGHARLRLVLSRPRTT
jgi:hypothetical protein